MKGETHYEYRFEDHSILLRVLEPVLFLPLVRALPRGITPNQITLAGQCAAVAGFGLVFASRPLGAATFVLLAAAALFYTVADCIDGLFARHTKQTSRLGELLDHWLDAISVPLVVLSLGLALPAAGWLVFAGVVVISFLHFATFLHGFRLGHVHLGAIGVIEGITIGAVVCLIAAGIGAAPFAQPVLGNFSVASLLLLALVVGSCGAMWGMRGLARYWKDLSGPAILFIALAGWFAFGRVPLALAGVVVISVGSYLEGKVIRARLLRGPLVLWDPILFTLVPGAAAVALTLNLEAGVQALFAGLVAAYAFIREGRAFFQTVAGLRAPLPAAPPPSNATSP